MKRETDFPYVTKVEKERKELRMHEGARGWGVGHNGTGSWPCKEVARDVTEGTFSHTIGFIIWKILLV